MKIKHFALLMTLLTGCFQAAYGGKLSIQDKVSLIKSQPDYDGWRSNYQDKDWVVEALFVDLNMDGHDEVFLTFPNQRDRMGSSWRFLSTCPQWERPKRRAGDLHLYCHSYNLYELTLCGDSSRLVGIHAGLETFASEKSVESSEGTFVLGMTDEGRLSAQCISNGVVAILFNPAFSRLLRVVPEVYSGYDMRQTQRGTSIGEMTERSLPQELPDDIKRALGELNREEGRVVCFDADNDGDTDCYLAAGASEGNGCDEDWCLYLNKGGHLEKAAEPIVLNRKRGYAVTALDPRVRASTNGFFKVVFNYKTSEDAVVVLAKENGKLVLRGRESCLREYSSESVLSAEGLVSDFGFASLERLPCQTYKMQTLAAP